MKVAKIFRLLKKHQNEEDPKYGQWNVDGAKEVERERVVVPESYIKDMNAQAGTSGLLYVIDEKATQERDEKQAQREKNGGQRTEAANIPAAKQESQEEKEEREHREQHTNLKHAIAEGFDIDDTTVAALKAFITKHEIPRVDEKATDKASYVSDVAAWLALPIAE